MTTLNYALSGGDKVLLGGTPEVQLEGRNARFQFSQTGIVASTVKIEVYMRNNPDFAWQLIDTLTIDPAKPTDYITIVGASFEYIQFKLVTGGVTVGTINKVDLIK